MVILLILALLASEPHLTKRFPTAQFVTIPGTGHWCYQDNPEFWMKEMLAFIPHVSEYEKAKM